MSEQQKLCDATFLHPFAGNDALTLAREVDVIVEALRATREAATNLLGLQRFRKGLRGEQGPALLLALLARMPRCAELHAIWDAQLTVRP